MLYQLRLDYATFNFDKGSMDVHKVGRLLADTSDLAWRQKGLNENSPQYSPLGLRWLGNSGYDAAPHKLEVSGVGCEHFGPTLPFLRSVENTHFSRLDFAFDVVMPRSDWRKFITLAFGSSLESNRVRKRYRLSGDGEAMTIYIGSRKGAKFFRIYNKTLEDSKYSFEDPTQAGKTIDLPDDCCVIRYEVELHRHKVVSSSSVRLFDPSPMFDWYYSERVEDRLRLFDEIRNLWLSFGDEVLLPDGFADDCSFVTRIEQNKKYAQCSSTSGKLEIVKDALHDYPHAFDRVLSYVVDKFGKYIPYIVLDKTYLDSCMIACKREFGFAPDLIVESAPQGFSDLEDCCGEDDINDWVPWVTVTGDQLEFNPIFDEGR